MNANAISIQNDDLSLQKIIKGLCTKGIRKPMTHEQVKSWLTQFNTPPEKTLALLIVRNLIYRTTNQFESLLKQALKSAAKHFIISGTTDVIAWQDVLFHDYDNITFYFGPLQTKFVRPGKSGEVIIRQLKQSFSADPSRLHYPADITKLEPDERFLLVDDGAFTGAQLTDCINGHDVFRNEKQVGVVLGVVHEVALDKLSKEKTIPIFFGEKITKQECFEAMSEKWVADRIWPYSEISPIDQYNEVVRRAKFADEIPLGWGNLGCMVVYEHGVPDNTLQLLWDRSDNWNPLFNR